MPSPPDDAARLAGIDIGPAERAAYELVVDRPSATLAELTAEWRRPEPLAWVLATLEERTFVSSVQGPPTRYRPAAPDIAFGALLDDYGRQLDEARQHVSVLDAAYQARPRGTQVNTVVEVVNGERAVRQRLAKVQRGVRDQLACLAKRPSFARADIGQLRGGLVWRAIYDRTAIEHPGALATVEELSRTGQDARVVTDLPVSLYLIDNRLAFVPLPQVPGAPEAAIVVHPSGLLDALAKLFDGLWQRALPLHPPSGRSIGSGGREASDMRGLVALLLSGLTDESIARQLDISHRTAQRRVAALMVELDAHTRFQAGVRAALHPDL